MPKKVTYGVAGLIDWTAIIPIGNARMKVHFSGGALTKYGVTPAEFTTTDPLTQRVIEASHYYRSGRITTLRSVGVHQVQPVSRRCSAQAKEAFENAMLPFDDTPAPESSSAQLRSIEVACIEDAIEYMRDHYKLPAVTLRTVDALQSAAKLHGISFIIKD